MASLGATLYDPAAAATLSTASLLAMTALDTTNLRVTFTAPANGIVLVRIRVPQKGAVTNPMMLLGVLDGAVVRGRVAPCAARVPGSATLMSHEACFLVSGLTPGQSYTWDAAYGVEFAVASTTIGWGGPNNTLANDAYGGASFEVWDTVGLLAGTLYDPAIAVSAATTASLAMTAFDTTNLRLSFTAPASGRVLVRLRCMAEGATSMPSVLLGVLDGATVRMRQAPIGGFTNSGTLATTDQVVIEALAVVSGLTSGTRYTWDAAYGVEGSVALTNIKYGGPDNATQDDAFGGIAFEIWAA